MVPPRPNEGKTQDSAVVAFRCPKKFLEKLKKLAAAENRTINNFVYTVLQRHVDGK